MLGRLAVVALICGFGFAITSREKRMPPDQALEEREPHFRYSHPKPA